MEIYVFEVVCKSFKITFYLHRETINIAGIDERKREKGCVSSTLFFVVITYNKHTHTGIDIQKLHVTYCSSWRKSQISIWMFYAAEKHGCALKNSWCVSHQNICRYMWTAVAHIRRWFVNFDVTRRIHNTHLDATSIHYLSPSIFYGNVMDFMAFDKILHITRTTITATIKCSFCDRSPRNKLFLFSLFSWFQLSFYFWQRCLLLLNINKNIVDVFVFVFFFSPSRHIRETGWSVYMYFRKGWKCKYEKRCFCQRDAKCDVKRWRSLKSFLTKPVNSRLNEMAELGFVSGVYFKFQMLGWARGIYSIRKGAKKINGVKGEKAMIPDVHIFICSRKCIFIHFANVPSENGFEAKFSFVTSWDRTFIVCNFPKFWFIHLAKARRASCSVGPQVWRHLCCCCIDIN